MKNVKNAPRLTPNPDGKNIKERVPRQRDNSGRSALRTSWLVAFKSFRPVVNSALNCGTVTGHWFPGKNQYLYSPILIGAFLLLTPWAKPVHHHHCLGSSETLLKTLWSSWYGKGKIMINDHPYTEPKGSFSVPGMPIASQAKSSGENHLK